MEIKRSHVGALTNKEVLTILNKQIKHHNYVQKQFDQPMPEKHKLYPCVWIAKEVKSYLMETIASSQTRQDIEKLLTELSKIDTNDQLTRLEKLQIINLRPTSEPQIISIVQQCHRKFPKREDIARLLNAITNCLPEADDDEEEEDESEQE